MGTWHMAYEEATFHAALREQKTLEAGKAWCNKFVEKIVKQQIEQLKNVKEAHQQKRKIDIGIIGLSTHGSHIVMEAVQGMMQDNLSNYHFNVVTSQQPNGTLLDQIHELSELLHVQVFIGPEMETDLTHLLAWARRRSHPSHLIVFITPAVITAPQLNLRGDDKTILIQMSLPSSANLVATAYLIKQQNLSMVLMLVNSADRGQLNQIQSMKNITGAEVIKVTVEEITPATKILRYIETSVPNRSNIGLLITRNYMFGLLSRIPRDSWIFSIPWFTTVERILNDPYFDEYNFLSHKNFDLSYALFVGNTVKNEKWHQNVSSQIIKSGVYSDSETEYISNILEPVFDSSIVATHIGTWLTNKNISVKAFQRRLSWESSMWAGMSGLLKIDESLKRDYNSYLSLHLKNNITGQFLHYPSGEWQALNDLAI
ncbi:uncharacterized protein LOC135219688 isoform X2 [Macrobrachium nipponense]|uniref:uncharacterized protein LOC135219688 isoform X2 n=1 Tax=Macrobrachium nipponense TaxID=159736 RepID=UPI0030C81D4B